MKKLSADQAKTRIEHYCAYQERSHQEVKRKLYTFGLTRSEVDELLTALIVSGFLNEERYARAFAGGKFRMKKWGRIKIINALEAQGLTANCIRAGLSEIDAEDYRKTLVEVLQKKINGTDLSNLYVARDKASTFAIQKGYEPDLVWEILKQLLPDR